MLCAKAGAQHACVKAVHSIKNCGGPMPLCYSVKAALSYTAALCKNSFVIVTKYCVCYKQANFVKITLLLQCVVIQHSSLLHYQY